MIAAKPGRRYILAAMPSDPSLYDRDILAWSEQQAALLRRLAAGERGVNGVDWENVVEEVESVGRSELKAVASLLEQALLHALKLSAWPESPAANHWLSELGALLSGARRRYEPGMRQRVDLDDIYAGALGQLALVQHDGDPRPVPPSPPLELRELMDRGLSARDLVARLSERPTPPAG